MHFSVENTIPHKILCIPSRNSRGNFNGLESKYPGYSSAPNLNTVVVR